MMWLFSDALLAFLDIDGIFGNPRHGSAFATFARSHWDMCARAKTTTGKVDFIPYQTPRYSQAAHVDKMDYHAVTSHAGYDKGFASRYGSLT